MAYSDKTVTGIAKKMVAPGRNFSGPTEDIPGIYTYLGQMISHDIVPNTNPFAASRDVHPWLNLSSLYGDSSINDLRFGSKDNPFIENNEFKLVERTNADSSIRVMDFHRVRRGHKFEALVPEARNDENLIIMQLHILLLKLHNFFIEENVADNAWEARQLVVLLFQYVVVHEFLKKFIQEDVYRAYFEQGRSYFPDWDKSQIPTYFSHAAFRFGHSTVRSIYTFRRDHCIPLSPRTSELFRKGQKLSPYHKIKWADFFPQNTNSTDNHALQIDTVISTGMDKINANNPNHPEVNVIIRNVQAGFNANLRSGWDYFEEINSHINRYRDTINIPKVTSLKEMSFGKVKGVTAKNLPLWLYILSEASQTHNGNRLGAVGSILVTEVIRRSIAGSNISLYEAGNMQISPRALKRLEEIKIFIDVNKNKSVIAQIADLVD